METIECREERRTNMLDLAAEIQRCAVDVHERTMMKIVAVESAGNPYAIGISGNHLERQPRSKSEAVATVQQLERDGWNYSVGLAQVNKHNFRRLGLTVQSAFEPCTNLQAGSTILKECYERAKSGRLTKAEQQRAIRDALSCYYSGSYTTGYRLGYVQRVVAALPVLPKDRKDGGSGNQVGSKR